MSAPHTGTSLRPGLLLAATLITLVLVTAGGAETASNSVPPSKLGSDVLTATVSTIKPAACNGITLTTLVQGTTSTLNGTNGADLLLAGVGARTLDGRGGNDCIVGSSTTQSTDGGTGTDVCIGWTSTYFQSCAVVVRR